MKFPSTEEHVLETFASSSAEEDSARAVARRVVEHVAHDVCMPSGRLDAAALREIVTCLHHRLYPMVTHIPSCAAVRMANHALHVLTTQGSLSAQAAHDFAQTYALLLCGFERYDNDWTLSRGRLAELRVRLERFAYLHNVSSRYWSEEKASDAAVDAHLQSALANMNKSRETHPSRARDTAGATVYGRNTCPFCRMALQRLDDAGISYRYTDVSESRRPLAELVGRDVHTIPQIFIDGQYVGGYDDLMAHLEAGGQDPSVATDVDESELAEVSDLQHVVFV